MIVVSKERYLPVLVNTMILSKDDWYFYIHRDVYDQAVVLTDRFPGSAESLLEQIGGVRRNLETMDWFYRQAPKPINILAPYLTLIQGEIEQDMELCCGVLHVITAMISVRNFILKPAEIRKSVLFSLSIREEYEMAWERFFVSSIPYEQRGAIVPAAPVAEPPVPAVPVPTVMETTHLFPKAVGHFVRLDAPPSRPGMVSTEAERNKTKSLLL